MRKVKVLLSLILVVVMLISGTAFGVVKEGINHTALGDSIAYGTGSTELFGYTDMLNEHFTRIYGEGTFNKDAYDGVKSGDLMDLLTGEENDYEYLLPDLQKHVMNSDIITVSIGGNDLLTPFRELLLQFLSNNYLDESFQIDYEVFMEDFMKWQDGVLQLENMELAGKFHNLFFNEMLSSLQAGALEFSTNFPIIMNTIRTSNPDAKIYVNTIYNPFVSDEMLHDFAIPFVEGMNSVITNENLIYAGKYEVVDVYTKFEKYNNPKKLEVGDLRNFFEYIMSVEYTTPVPLHPTDKGYKFIFNLHKDLLE